MLQAPDTLLTHDIQRLSGWLSAQRIQRMNPRLKFGRHCRICRRACLTIPCCGFKHVTALFYLLINEHHWQQYGVSPVYIINSQLDSTRLNSYGFDSTDRGGHGVIHSGTGSTALYCHNGSHFGLGLDRDGPDEKINGLHDTKHTQGDINCKLFRMV